MRTMQSRFLALSLASLAGFAFGGNAGASPGSGPAAPLELRMSRGLFHPLDPARAPEAWYAAPTVERSARGDLYRVAIAQGALSPEDRQRLETAGAELLDYLPIHGYRLRVAPENEAAIAALPFVAWLGALPSEYKVAAELAERAQASATNASAQERFIAIRVVLFPGEPAGRAVAVLGDSLETATPSGKDGAWRITAHVPEAPFASVLSSLIALPEVEAVEPLRGLRPLNQDAVWVHQSFVGPSPQQTPVFDHGIYGCGQIVGIADTGQDYDACFFRDTVNGPPPITACTSAPCPPGAPAFNRRKDVMYYNWSGTANGDDLACSSVTGGGHGTHTSGSIAADNSPYANCSTFASAGRNGGDGEAPGAKLVIQEMGDGLEYLNTFGGTVWNLSDVAYQSGARIHANSWGGACVDSTGSCVPGCTLPYESLARDADLAMWTYPDLLLVYAAGNASVCAPPNAVTTPATAKSVVSVGSVGHGTSASTPSASSSHGPVFDGRLKPTLAAQGESTVSAASDGNPATNNCSTCSLSGTSMSSPTVGGLAALAREYYTAGFYPGGVRSAPAGFTPSGALVKATLIDGAVALGAAQPAPDFVSGYGRILLGGTLAFTGGAFKLRVDDHREGIGNGSIVVHAYDVAAGTPLRATLVWSDYPAALDAAVARVNTLKLEAIDPSGNVWFQRLDAATGAPVQTSNALDTHDPVNVEERLVFNTPAAGRWIVRVIGVDVPWGPQPFALVVRGSLTDCPATGAPAAPSLATPASHQVQVSWGAVGGAARYNVYRRLGTCAGTAPWVRVATAVSGTSYLDSTVSGGTAYSYYVVATSDTQAACESPRSPCASVVPTGDCTLDPDFHGIVSAASAGASQCQTQITWGPGSAPCPGDVRYNIYRSTSPVFTPSAANRIARCVIGTSYVDSVGLSLGTNYYYVVRAEDATAGHGGPCRGGNEDNNTIVASAAPDGPATIGTWTDDAGDTGTAKFSVGAPWTLDAVEGHAGPKVYRAASAAGACADLTTPTLTLADPGQGPTLTFWTKRMLEFDPDGPFGSEGSVGQVEVATGPSFDNWTRVPLTPDYPQFVDFTLINCTSTGDAMTFFAATNLTYATHTASLNNWAGGEVKLRFHLSGDFLTGSGSWWVDDVAITKTSVPGSCATTSAGPPPIPDGGPVPGTPMLAAKSGGNVVVTWDATKCPATAVNIYYGAIGSYGGFTGGFCNRPASGTASVAMGTNRWFLVAASNGGSTDGSWARKLDGSERSYTGAAAACGATTHVTNNGCP